jgi:hypothetical protein
VGETTPSASEGVHGLVIEAVEWLPSGAESGLVRVRGRWNGTEPAAELPALLLRAEGREHRFDSLPDARFGRDAASWRGTYLVPAALVTEDPEALWLEWAERGRSELPPVARGVEPPPVGSATAAEPPAGGAQVIDRAVLAERRARRAEASEQAQARIAAEAIQAVEVLELRSAELERRLEEASAERDALAAGSSPAAPPEPDRAALSAALESGSRLRAQAHDWRVHLRASEAARSAGGVRHAPHETAALAALEGELADAREAAAAARAELERERAAVADDLASARGAWERRVAELEAALAAVRAEIAERVASAEAAVASAEARLQLETVARAALEDELDRERAARAPLDADLQAALAARASAEGALAALRGDLAAVTAERERASAQLAMAQTEIEDARTEAAAAEHRLRAAVDAAHTARAVGRAALEDARAAATAAEVKLEMLQQQADASAADAAAAQLEVVEARAAREAAESALEQMRAARDAAEAALAAAREDAERSGASLSDRIAELERGAEPDRLHRLAREQAEAAAAARQEATAGSDLAARLDAAASALRERTPEPPADAPPAAADPEAADPPRDPVLRRALVRLAEDDREAAARLLAGLLPGQAAVVAGPLSYDLTIRGLGTFAVTLADGAGRAEPIPARRTRREAAFHLAAGPRTLAELLAGEPHRIGRLSGPVRFRGRRRRLAELRPLVDAPLSLAEAARAGAAVEPGLAWRTLGAAVRPAWTRGLHFTIEQVTDAESWYVSARDGAGLAVTSGPPPQPPVATVTMSRAAFDRLLRDEPHVAGDRPSIRGDRDAVAALLALADRARR